MNDLERLRDPSHVHFPTEEELLNHLIRDNGLQLHGERDKLTEEKHLKR